MLGYLEVINSATVRCQTVIRLLAAVGMIAFFALPSDAQQTLKMGPISGDLGVQAGLKYTDNINNSTNKQSDLAVQVGPTFNGGLTLPVHIGRPNGDEMTLTAGVSYQETFSVTSNYVEQTFSSPVSVNLMIPIRFGDTFSFDNTSLDNAVLASQKKVDTYNNTASINLDRNYGKAGISFGVERIDKVTPQTPSQDETDYQVSMSPSLTLRENYKLFWTTTYGMVFPKSSARQEVHSITSEVGLSGQITPSFNGTLSAGYGLSHLYPKTLGPGSGIFGGIFDPRVLPAQNFGGISSSMSGSYTHPLRPNTTYSMSAFRSPGVTAMLSASSVQSVTGVSLGIAHQLSKTLTIAPVFQFTNIESLGVASNHERENLLSLTMVISRQFSERLSGMVQYQYVNRISSLPGQTFDVTQITAQGNYRF